MKRASIETILGWLDAIRRRDVEAVGAALDEGVVWQGVRDDFVCRGRDEVALGFIGQRDEGFDIDSLELIGAPEHVVLHARVPSLHDIDGVEARGEIYNVFTLSAGTIVRIDDYLERSDALSAANLTP